MMNNALPTLLHGFFHHWLVSSAMLRATRSSPIEMPGACSFGSRRTGPDGQLQSLRSTI